MKRKLLLVLVAAAVVTSGTNMIAHHAFSAEFDADRPVKLKGAVVKMEWVNPHAWIHIDVKGPDGTVQRWMIETGAPNSLIRRGFNRRSLLAGTEINVEAFQARDGSFRANGRDVTFPDGSVLFLGSTDTGAPGDDKIKK